MTQPKNRKTASLSYSLLCRLAYRKRLWPLLCSILLGLLWPASGPQLAYSLAAQAPADNFNIDLRSPRLLRRSSSREEAERQRLNQIQNWLQTLQALMQSQNPEDPQAAERLREASAQEAALFRAIEQLASYYGFASRYYSLASIKTMYSFSGNLEILIPAAIDNNDARDILQQGQLPGEIWQQVYQSKREVLLLTAISGVSTQDIAILLAFMSLAAESAPPLPVRIVFLGSELPPSQLSDFVRNAPLASTSSYPIGSRSFLYHYQLPEPYGLLYLYHQAEKRALAHSQLQIWQRSGYSIVEELQNWWQGLFGSSAIGLRTESNAAAGNAAATDSESGQASLDLHVIYSSPQGQPPADESLQLAQALGSQNLSYHFNNGSKLLRVLSRSGKQAEFFQLSKPYLEKHWPISVLYQEPPDGEIQSGSPEPYILLTQALWQFVQIKLEQAIEEQRLHNSQKLMRGSSARSTDLASFAERQEGRHYWLWDSPSFLSTAQLPAFLSRLFYLSNLSQGYISERQILYWVLLAVAVFAWSSLAAHSHIRRLRLIHRIKLSSICKYALGALIFIVSYTLLANEALLFILESLTWLYSDPLATTASAAFSLGLLALLKICFALLFLYSSALGLNLEHHLEARILPYLSQCMAFATLLFLLWQDFSLGLVGLYLFFLYSLYTLLFSPRLPRKPLLRLLQAMLQHGIIWLLFLSCFLLTFALPLSLADLLGLLSSRNLANSTWTLALFVPGLLLHFAQIQLRRLHRPKTYHSYLLRHITLYILTIALGIGLLILLQSRSSADSTQQQSENFLAASSERLRLQELFVLPQACDGSSVAENQTVSGEAAPEPARQRQCETEGYKVTWLGSGAEPANAFEPTAAPAVKIVPASTAADSQLSAIQSAKPNSQRPLQASELEALQQLGQSLLRSNDSRIRGNYSSILELNSDVQLSYIDVQVQAQPLELLYASVPFSIPILVPGQTQPMQSSQLLIGFFPPPRWQLELLLGQVPQQYRLHYDLEFYIPTEKVQRQLRQQGDPLALRLFPLLSQLHSRNSGDDGPFQVGRDFDYLVVIRGLEKVLR